MYFCKEFASFRNFEIIYTYFEKNHTVPLIVADICTFSETGVSHRKQKSRNNLTSPHAITIKLKLLIHIEKKK